MTITDATADALDALALQIFNANIVPSASGAYDPSRYTGLKSPDASTDQQYYTLIAPVMQAIDGRTMPPGFQYTLNITCALLGRPKHWYIQGIGEDDSAILPPASVGLALYEAPGGSVTSVGSYGWSLGLATCAAICHAWAATIRMWLAGDYPLAVSPPPAA